MHKRECVPFYNQSFVATVEIQELIEDTMQRGGYRNKSNMFRDAIMAYNQKLRGECSC